MDQLRAQLGNYLEWLESRGLSGPMAFRATGELPNSPGPQHDDTEKSATPPATPSSVSEETQTDARSAAALRSVAAPAPSPAETQAPQREAGCHGKSAFIVRVI